MALRGDLLTLPERSRQAMREVWEAVIARKLSAVMATAREAWPVRTGRSKAGLEDPSVTAPYTVRAVGEAEYTTAIVSHGVSPWQAFVVRPSLAAARAAPREIGREVLRRLKSGANGG